MQEKQHKMSSFHLISIDLKPLDKKKIHQEEPVQEIDSWQIVGYTKSNFVAAALRQQQHIGRRLQYLSEATDLQLLDFAY